MSFIHFLRGEKIGLDLPKPRLGIVWGKELLDVLVQPELIFLDRKHVIGTLFQNLGREPFLSVQGVSGDHFSRNFHQFQGGGSLGDLVFLRPTSNCDSTLPCVTS